MKYSFTQIVGDMKIIKTYEASTVELVMELVRLEKKNTEEIKIDNRVEPSHIPLTADPYLRAK